MRVAVGSKNSTKVGAVEQAFQNLNAVILSVSVPSGVSNQPLSDEETLQGAINRAENARKEMDADIGVGLEGGVAETAHGLFLCNWGALTDRNGIRVMAGGARIKLPDEFLIPLKEGKELSIIMEQYTKQKNIGTTLGAVGVFTNGYVERQEMFLHVSKLLIGQYLFQTGKERHEDDI
ncbi:MULTISPECIES: DUF84 family protein [unclassified Thermoactinomyces]|jgi:inosine/xanthosine triphosphatase|uniref:DUF84 family protein n=1 Tax=unclassified Thermoactinomyces TaxID=2634588 RepID=UPI0018DE2649|nr:MULTISPECIES: DUF84 family protein [unclassified Thermoactinomyces]MBH8599572.1 DUF84 family protein [Thermoactinomyces sp. CICC 10523]MBH8605705.1 DUF84 family protein [Thermoactinomyces sp. CICC 10522]MBH8608895.1 DUF84 family protein [Thermoactinomyces sp. CICC 10521]